GYATRRRMSSASLWQLRGAAPFSPFSLLDARVALGGAHAHLARLLVASDGGLPGAAVEVGGLDARPAVTGSHLGLRRSDHAAAATAPPGEGGRDRRLLTGREEGWLRQRRKAD